MSDDFTKDEYWYWSTDLSVGVCQIDDDHKLMFQLFHEAYLLSQNQPNSKALHLGLASELVQYIESLFKRKEAIMLASSIPFYENYFSIHKLLLQKIQQELSLIKSGKKSVIDFVIFLRNWFIGYIKNSGQCILEYTAGNEHSIHLALEKYASLIPKQRCHIYLVDDDQAYINLMQAMVDAAGFKCTSFSSGALFLETPITNDDLVVLDLNMPEKDGIEVMRELTEKQLSPAFILISGFDERVLHSARQFAESKQLNVADILSKPIETEDFIDTLINVYAKCKLAYLLKETKDTKDTKIIEKPSEEIGIDELIQAINQHELIIYIQPQVDFSNGALTGGEVLVRWQHSEQGLVFPDQFIPLAEQHYLMGELTEAVILESIKAYKQIRTAGIDIRLSINLSAQNINNLALPEKLETLLKTHAISPETFVLELTESAILTNTSESLDIFNRLRMKGFSLSIDDFGTGDSSLKKLYQSPFSELKIDQHFVSRIEKDPDAISIVKVCVLLAKEFKMRTVAEGVETQAIWDKLKALDCDIAQGYFIARPMPITDFINWAVNDKN